MTYIAVCWVTSILTSIYEVIHFKIDIQRYLIFIKIKNLDSLDSFTYKKTPCMLYKSRNRKLYILTSNLTSIFDFFSMEVITVKVIFIFKVSLMYGILPKTLKSVLFNVFHGYFSCQSCEKGHFRRFWRSKWRSTTSNPTNFKFCA